MEVFHGSEKIIEAPNFDFRNTANDYGRGFYCTEDIELAKEWACKKSNNGFANIYDLDTEGLNICNLNGDEYNILNWLALLTKNRGYWQNHTIAEDAKVFLQKEYLPDTSAADIIIGYRADDSYFSFAQDFISGVISLQQLAKAMYLGKLGEQIVLKSEKAFSSIKFKGYKIAEAEIYYQKKAKRDIEARREYGVNKASRNVDDIYIIDILRGRVKEDDLRI